MTNQKQLEKVGSKGGIPTTQPNDAKPKVVPVEIPKTIADSVLNKISEYTNQGRLDLPKNYSVGNALSSAWLKILATKDTQKRPAIQVATKESIANALLNMAILGLNPAKDQGYFIVYGDQLTWFTSYFGNVAAIKRFKGIGSEVVATLIYDGDEIVLEHNELGEEIISSHETSWANKEKGVIIGVYATVIYNNVKRSAVLSMKEVKESWSQSLSNKEHAKFTGEFAKRTAINRLVKMILKTSNDDDLLAETIIASESKHYSFDDPEVEEAIVHEELEEKANKGATIDIGIEEVEKPKELPKSESKANIETKTPKEEQQTLFEETPKNRGF